MQSEQDNSVRQNIFKGWVRTKHKQMDDVEESIFTQ